MDPMLVVAGALTGLVVGVTGVGGGALMTPILLLFFGVVPTVAVGTDLWFAAITKLVAARIHHRHGLIDWQVAKRLWWGSLPASVITLVLIKTATVNPQGLQLLKSAIAVAILLTAVGMLLQRPVHAVGRRLRLGNAGQFKTLQAPLTVACGALLGIVVSMTSVGAGALGAMFLVYLYPLRLTPPRLIATDIVHAVPLAMFAGTGHFLMGNVNFTLLGTLLLGSIPGVLAGSLLSSRLPHAPLRMLLALILTAIGIKLWIDF